LRNRDPLVFCKSEVPNLGLQAKYMYS